MTLPHRADDYVVLDDDWNAHVDAINTNTGKNADQDAWIVAHLDGTAPGEASHSTINTRLDGAESNLDQLDGRVSTVEGDVTAVQGRVSAVEGDVTGLDGRIDTAESNITSLDGRVTTLETEGGGGGGGVVAPHPDDTALYGDVISNVARRDAWFGEPLENGYMTVAATIATKSLTAPTTAMFGVLTPAQGAGTFRWALYKGPSVDALSLVDQGGWTAAVTTAGVQDGLVLNDFSITAGEYVAMLWLGSGYSTPANLASTPFATGTQNLIAQDNSVYSVYDGSDPATLPSTLDLTTGWTRASNQFWFSIR